MIKAMDTVQFFTDYKANLLKEKTSKKECIYN